MKKFILALLVCVGVTIATSNTANAVNYTYKVLNPKLKQENTAVFGTMSITNTQYVWGFYTPDGKPLCVAGPNPSGKNNEGGLFGLCTEANAFIKFMQGEKIDLSQYNLFWKETQPNTFYREKEDIRQERAKQGKHEFNGVE